ncbi:MAG: aminoacetone oxidase family FAD-binding enzyme [Chitinophagales bacterium]|nr:aminoacetone oxidase family FAD-binding enzyme [Chitinophagales bacterium]
MKPIQIAIIGAGASGVFAAHWLLARLGKDIQIDIFEKQLEPLTKVKISGGGRCNVTHQHLPIKVFSSRYPRGQAKLKYNLQYFSSQDMLNWLEKRGVKTKVESDGRIFPITDTSKTIVQTLLDSINSPNCTLHLNTKVEEIHQKEHVFELKIDQNTHYFDYLIIATGGIAVFKDFFNAFDIKKIPFYPSLFSFQIPDPKLRSLMGISLNSVKVRLIGQKLEIQDALLITHWGLSGPALLKLSAFEAERLQQAKYIGKISINWVDTHVEEIKSELFAEKKKPKSIKVKNYKRNQMPQRLLEYLIEKAEIHAESHFHELKDKEINKLAETLTNQVLDFKGKTTYKEEFVSAGGIDLNELTQHYQLMKIPNCYVLGEAVDVDGITGGFNFQHAWSSAYLAAQDIANRIKKTENPMNIQNIV